MEYFLLVVGLIILFLYNALRADPAPLYGRYSLPGKWYYLKYAVFYTTLKLRSIGVFKFLSRNGYGNKSRDSDLEIDRPQPLSEHELAIDATYFNGFNKEGYYIGAGIQRRTKNRVETLLFLRVPEIGILEWPFAPDTAAPSRDPNGFETNGLKFESVEAMKHWRLTYEGLLKVRSSGQLLRVKFQLDWAANSPHFDFDTDMKPHPVADAIAREPWSRDLFKQLERSHQTHTEQFGMLSGALLIEGHEPVHLQLISMHDHSYGLYRNWNDFNRYILHYFGAEDGTRIAIHLVSIAGTFSHLVVGFVIDSSGHKHAIHSCEQALYDYGEDGVPAECHRLHIAADGKTYNLLVEAIDGAAYFCGWNREARIEPRFCKASINLVPGYGMCEWEYRNRKCAANNSILTAIKS